ncbi:hypothetical protein KGF54_005406 [Candida jiufengensis]|uniref:uncharacterized protein n=1 Tax=Candida jiufengensis TaxID=497108 RepID=UPI0022241BF6|nr:uncharacterized protein KGF54_005406 [Candida jiufengensis]KAI5949928.1 hypothetical protein KGF54_005406 [Candida jiufengensis]
MKQNDYIELNLDQVEEAFKCFQISYPITFRDKFYKFNNNISINENLNHLSLFALHNPILSYYCYKPIFLELISRWIQSPNLFEQSSTFITGCKILSSLSQLLNISYEYLNLFELFLQNFEFEYSKNIDIYELDSILLSYYRLLQFDTKRFKQYIKPNIIYNILENEESKVSKYFAIQIITMYISASEQVRNNMFKKYDIGEEIYSKNSSLNHYFLPLAEAKRISNIKTLPTLDSHDSKNILKIPYSDISTTLLAPVCGILIPKLHNVNSTQQIKFVPTGNSIKSLKQLAQNIQLNKPVMLVGNAGSGKTFLVNKLADDLSYSDSIVKIHLGEQTDAKLLLGTYTSGEKPGTFQWNTGVLTSAVKEGKWVLIEDIDKAPTEILSIILTLLEKRTLSIPSRGEVIEAKNGFQLFSTVRTDKKSGVPDMIGSRFWETIELQPPTEEELKYILQIKFPKLKNFLDSILKCYYEVLRFYDLKAFISLNKGSLPRIISTKDLIKFCSRCEVLLEEQKPEFDVTIYDDIFAEAVSCFGSAIVEPHALEILAKFIGEKLEIPSSRINLFLSKHAPVFQNDIEFLKVGRAVLKKSSDHKRSETTAFARTNHALHLMEQIGVGTRMAEPLLLVGETGTGKTTIVQQIAKILHKTLTVINVSQQTEAGDLLGGYKPINSKTLAINVQDVFEKLFLATFSEKKNERFNKILSKCFNNNQWKNVARLWKEAYKSAIDVLSKQPENDEPRKKRKTDKSFLLQKWDEFQKILEDFEIKITAEHSFVFDFVEGSLVKAIKNGDWLLLDEINLASSDTLENIADLLNESIDQRSILLSERGDTEPLKAHPEFRIFGCMNPSTDVGKRDLPVSIRSRFTEIYVHSPDKDLQDLLKIINKYIGRFAIGDEWVVNDIAELYLKAKALSESNKIVDGANQRPHFSIRTLTRTLIYVCDIIPIYGLRRSLFEGFSMTFLTLLDIKSEEILKPEIIKYTIGKLKNMKSIMSQMPQAPNSGSVQFKHYWLKHGPNEIIPQPNYIITPFVEKNLLNLVRATAGRRFPVLIQGPTSAGKTSMINYLANITGHKFVRINNHEHTDLQEYLGTYVSDSSGKLIFQEGILVEALKKGYWIVLDELNLAPTDVLEALNRLLDDNRELFIPETQEIVKPHPDFMLFATQNPPGLYGGRKVLSRAFRNRFLELHFDDIPQDELEIILRQRCQIAPSYAKKIVDVYKQLTVQRQSTRLFEQKNSFATLRDLFRWATREAVGYEELAINGYMLLAERVRKDDEKIAVKETIEKVMKVKLDMESYCENYDLDALIESDTSVVWTKAMRRLAILVLSSIKNKEPLLLVGETGCGKTTVCQVIADFYSKQLISVNAHQNTETGDLLGSQRPMRNKFNIKKELESKLLTYLNINDKLLTLDELISQYKISETKSEEIDELIKNNSVLFEWLDGPLVTAMKTGSFFLLDEISLADDSVLERLNSVLEPERSLLLAEKGSDDAFIIASDGFEFFATMNPGGDYGKKELSPALRNRFTEIWVPSMENFEDVYQIVESRLKQSQLAGPIVKFAKWYAMEFGGGSTSNGVISLRDILAWVEFINSCDYLEPNVALLHGALMVFIDALGTNNTAYLAENIENLEMNKSKCIKFLDVDTKVSNFEIQFSDDYLRAGHFSIPIKNMVETQHSFSLNAPTTAENAMKVVRAMQVNKPILLEGSPGVGKTSLITALASGTGNTLIRINLSEQTDLVDLFGSDAPAENGKAGEFAWRDAPFLRAMQRGEWVLLDEMNLASQSVLEGLNACLDHRGEAYIPELDKTFQKHKDFRIFAAQNPQYQGGGRKGLPKSFVNRFSVVYVDTLKSADLEFILSNLYPSVNSTDSTKLIKFISEIEDQVVKKKLWGHQGSPWEFNLRDSLRWLSLYTSKNLKSDIQLSDFLNMIICQRFRNNEDRERALTLFSNIFGSIPRHDNYFKLSNSYIQAGSALGKRDAFSQYDNGKLLPLQCNFQIMETILRCISNNLPVILTGPSNSGKTSTIRYMANICGAKLDEFSMNSEVDSMDILGGYEQSDLSREMHSLLHKIEVILNEHVALLKGNTEKALYAISLLSTVTLQSYEKLHEQIVDIVDPSTLKASTLLVSKVKQPNSLRFDWFDGLLVKAVENGHWLILDNANLCPPSVLDRLNSLLETNGTLIINECTLPNGEPRVLKPHPNFRLFLTVDFRFGELSRAMRNRGIEVYMDSLDERVSRFDKKSLKHITTTSYGFERNTNLRDFSLLEDSIQNGSICTSSTLGIIAEPQVNWKDFVFNSLDFASDNKSIVEGIFESFQLIRKFDLPLKSVYKNSDLLAAEVVNENVGFGEFQALHPLLNTSIISTIVDEFPFASTSESTMLFEMIDILKYLGRKLDTIEKSSMNKKIEDLSYIEKSAAVANGRNIKSVPRIDIYMISQDVFKFGVETITETKLFSKVIFMQLFKLFSMTQVFIQESNESKIRVFQELIISWCETNKATDLLKTIDYFGKKLELFTGLSMNEIWEYFRGDYPQTLAGWENLNLVNSLIADFDFVSKQQTTDVSSLALLFEELYRSIIENNYDETELHLVLEKVRNNLEELKNNSGKRSNVFKEEFTYVSDFIEDKNDLLHLYNHSERSLLSIIKDKNFRPYPSIIKTVSQNFTQIRALFTSLLFSSTISKTFKLQLSPAERVNESLLDSNILKSALINQSKFILADQKERFAKLLLDWIDYVYLAHPELSSHIKEQFLQPAIALANKSDNLLNLGKAWILFSTGLIQLYLPNHPKDPAIKEYVIAQVHSNYMHDVKQIKHSFESSREVLKGDQKTFLETTLNELDLPVPEKPKVYRPENSVDGLIDEWNAIMDSSIRSIDKLIYEIESKSEVENKVKLFQTNLSKFAMRMEQNYYLYSDLNDILLGFIYGLKFGLDITMIPSDDSRLSKTWFIDTSDMINSESVNTAFKKAKEFTKKLSVEDQAVENIMKYFMKISFATENEDVLNQTFKNLYYRWSLRKMREDQAKSEEGNLFKYKNVEENIDQDFQKLFPDYETIMDLDMNGGAKTNFEDVYVQIARSYIEHFYERKQIEMIDLTREGCEVYDVLNSFDLADGTINSSGLAATINLSHDITNKLTNPSSSFHFYKESNPKEVENAIKIVSDVHESSKKLSELWPEHATLKNIVFATSEFLSYPINLPLGRFLQKIEQIYTYIAEWQKYSSSQTSLEAQYNKLTTLIITWRKLELSTWNSLFKYEEITFENKVGAWWFHLLEVILIPILENNEEEDQAVKLLSALNIFMSNMSYGEFSSRLKILKAFRNHASEIDKSNKIVDALTNFVKFYDQFEPIIHENIRITKDKLQKDINEVLLLASWKDVNIDALKQSARKSHNNLYKIVRKYRDLLNTPVQAIIETGLSSDNTSKFVNALKLPLVGISDYIQEDAVKEINTWSERPQRLQNLSMIKKNLKIYVDRIGSETLPKFSEFADEVKSHMEELRKETPTQLKDDNKKLVAALKTQKMKLLSDSIREVRRSGLKTSMRSDIVATQRSVNLILANSKTLDGYVEGCDEDFFKILDLLPRLRAAIASPSDDVPISDLEKGMAAIENLIHLLVIKRSPIEVFVNRFSQLFENYTHLQKLSQMNQKNEILIQVEIGNLDYIRKWLIKLLDYANTTFRVLNQFSASTSETGIFSDLRNELNAMEVVESNLIVSTSSDLNKSERFKQFLNGLVISLTNWKIQNVKYAFVADIILEWLQKNHAESNINLVADNQFSIEDVEKEFRNLSSSILVAVQKVTETQNSEIDRDDDGWLINVQSRLSQYIKRSHINSVLLKIEKCIDMSRMSTESSNLISALSSFTLPLVEFYYNLCSNILIKIRENYHDLSKATFKFSSILFLLATKGFCSPQPPNEQKEDNNLHDGTGLGDGEGAQNNTNDVEEDEDLTEDAQKPNDEQNKDEDNDGEDDDAIEMEGDMAGELEDLSDQDKDDNEEEQDGDENEDLDEEIDDLDDLDPNNVDEKMWDEEAKVEKEKDSDKMPETSNNDEEMEAREDDENSKKDGENQNNKEDGDEENEEIEEKENDDDANEENDVGEQEDEVDNQEGEKLENVPESEVLDLPDDINLDGDENEESEENDEDDQKEDDLDEEETKEEENNLNDEENKMNVEESGEEDDDDMKEEHNEEEGQENEENGADSITEEPKVEDGDEGEDENDELEHEKQENPEEEEGGQEQEDKNATKGADGGADIENDQDEMDMDTDAAMEQEVGKSGEGGENEINNEENSDVIGSNTANNDENEKADKMEDEEENASSKTNESLKQIGESLKEFYRRRQEILEAQESQEEKEESANRNNNEFQHTEENVELQALGSANRDQIQSFDEDMAIDEEVEEDQRREENQNSNEDEEQIKDENEEDANEANAADDEAGGAAQSNQQGAEDNDEIVNGSSENMDIDYNELEEDDEEEIEELMQNYEINDNNQPPIPIEEARKLWKESELATQELASGLCEQLRLILEPTLSTKLRGDYKTGKRLNMKRIIPYIASDFKKDKIWLRRTKPSKRQYQIMIAVDDSKSMTESNSTRLAFHSIALVSKALTQLESGGLSIVRFGEDVKIVHPFDKPFSNETGAKIFQWFDFQQSRTDIKALCNQSLKIFENEKFENKADLWQLQIIISDGVCESHENILRMVRKARDEKIMMVFVVIDGINSKESIMDMQQVRYETDLNTGEMILKVDKYLDSFPFEFYVIVKNINELPEMLSTILRQYFIEISNV